MVILHWLGRVVVGCVGIAAAWAAWYVVYQSSIDAVAVDEKPKPDKSLAVEYVIAREDRISERIELVGNLIPLAQTEIRSSVDGYITELPFDLGDRVEKGDILCRLDDSKQRKALAQAQAMWQAATAQLGVRRSELELAQQNVEREEFLADRGAGTSQGLKTAQANLDIAQAQVELEQARVAEARAYVASLELGLQDFELRAPLSGFVASRMVDVGDLAKSDLPLMQIVDLDTVRTTVHVIEKDYHKVQPGQRASVSVDAWPEQTFRGTVRRIAPILDQETRTASVHIEVANPQQLLKPGMYARVMLDSKDDKTAVLIPVAAVLEVDSRSYVYTIDDDETARLREVQLGTTDGQAVEVRNGIVSGERVMTLGNRLVKAGQPVLGLEAAPDWQTSLADQPQESSTTGHQLGGE